MYGMTSSLIEIPGDSEGCQFFGLISPISFQMWPPLTTSVDTYIATVTVGFPCLVFSESRVRI